MLTDLDSGVLDTIRSGHYRRLFREDSFVTGKLGGTNCNWAKGFYTLSPDIIPAVLDIIRKEVEACNCFSGFQVAFSQGGGTGSGLGSKIMEQIRESYCDR